MARIPGPDSIVRDIGQWVASRVGVDANKIIGLTINLQMNELPTVTATFAVGDGELGEQLKRYELTLLEPQEAHDFEPYDDGEMARLFCQACHRRKAEGNHSLEPQKCCKHPRDECVGSEVPGDCVAHPGTPCVGWCCPRPPHPDAVNLNDHVYVDVGGCCRSCRMTEGEGNHNVHETGN